MVLYMVILVLIMKIILSRPHSDAAAEYRPAQKKPLNKAERSITWELELEIKTCAHTVITWHAKATFREAFAGVTPMLHHFIGGVADK